MFEIIAVMVANEEEQNINLFWRRQDALAALPEVLSEFLSASESRQAGVLMGDMRKLEKYLDSIGVELDIDEVEIEGQLDAGSIRKLEKLVSRTEKPTLAEVIPLKIAASGGCRTFIDGVEM
jgi:hypothetical protein